MSTKVIRMARLATRPGHPPGLLPVSPATIWRWTRERPDFPKPFKIGNQTTVWNLAEIEKFITNQS
jgi:predicted DNA-binding transcriptional regulator AlpA